MANSFTSAITQEAKNGDEVNKLLQGASLSIMGAVVWNQVTAVVLTSKNPQVAQASKDYLDKLMEVLTPDERAEFAKNLEAELLKRREQFQSLANKSLAQASTNYSSK